MKTTQILPFIVLLGCQSKDSTNEEEINDETENAYPDIEFYDFQAATPWYQAEGLTYPEESIVVTAFDKDYQYFGSEDRRTITTEVEFPETGDWAQIGLFFRLECPDSGKCDHWDRSGTIQLILDADTDNPTSVELLRHITPYRIGMSQYVDLTPLASLLKGKQTLSSFIDTWVGPGHAQGEGWNVTTRFVFYPGPPAGADEVINIWGTRSIIVGQLEEGETIADQIEQVSFNIPSDATKVLAHLTTTGHSFNNTNNCAEFCEMRHDLLINEATFSTNPWRSDCDENPVSPQYGTWEYSRNGWCPGAVSVGDLIDITEAVSLGQDNQLNFDILRKNGAVYNNASPADLLPYTITSLKLYVYK